MDYKAVFTKIGSLAPDFLGENIVIVFNDNAPKDLAEISYLHSIVNIDRDVRVGDVVALGSKDYVVTAVGEEANATFKKMGHCTFKFTGENETELPGQIELGGAVLPDIQVGDLFEVYFT